MGVGVIKWSCLVKRRVYCKGNIGVQIGFKDGKKLLIGTQKLADAQNVLQTYSNKLLPYEN
jgi:hypothetical protein